MAAPVAKKPLRLPPAPPVKASATVRRWLRTMTLRDQVAQLVFIPFYGTAPNVRTAQYRKFVRLIHETKVGGLILLNASNGRQIVKAEPYALGAFLNRMQRLATVPLMVGGDFERGASMRVEGTTVFPHAMAFGATGDPNYSKLEGEVTAREARALGVQWVYYPVADVNNNPDNPIINIRSFGENPRDVAAHVRAFIEGAHSDKKNYVLTTAKHFPGHGDTATDTHLNLATVSAGRERLESLELVPFRAAIAAGVDAIMTGHVAVPALAPPDLPATLSPAILTGLLRKELDFKGLVITDALDMGGIAQGFSAGDAAVRAFEAGADTLLMPTDPDAAIRAVVSAVQGGRISLARLQESVVRILNAKEKVGLDRKRFIDLEGMGEVVDDPEANAKAQEIASSRGDAGAQLRQPGPPLGAGSYLLRRDVRGALLHQRADFHPGSAQARTARAAGHARSHPEPPGYRGCHQQPARLRRLRRGGICLRHFGSRFGGTGRRSAPRYGDAASRRQASRAGGLGQSLSSAQFPQRGGVSGHLQHGAAVGNRRGEGIVG